MYVHRCFVCSNNNLTCVNIDDITRLVPQASIEVGHQRRNVLCGGEPLVHEVTHVEEAAGCYGDLTYAVTVERKRE